MVPKKHLCGIQTDHVNLTDDPLLPGDATPKGYVDERSVPPGGTTGQHLTKASNGDYDTEWSNAGGALSHIMFFNSNGTQDNIDLANGVLVFFNSNGSQDDIPVY